MGESVENLDLQMGGREGTRGVGGATTRKQEVARADRETLGRERETERHLGESQELISW